MAYQPHTLVTFGGKMNEKSAGDEIWQCGIRGFANTNDQVLAGDLHDLAVLIAQGPTGAGAGLASIWADQDAHIAQSATLNWVKCANIGADGKYDAEPQGVDFTGVPGGWQNTTAPSFCSVAISWTTGMSLGKGVRGRIYLPNYTMVSTQAGSVLDPDQIANLLVWSTDSLLFTIDQTDPNSPTFHPYVVSASGVSHKITGARIGNVYDTQRRRKNAVPETYVSRAFVP